MKKKIRVKVPAHRRNDVYAYVNRNKLNIMSRRSTNSLFAKEENRQRNKETKRRRRRTALKSANYIAHSRSDRYGLLSANKHSL